MTLPEAVVSKRGAATAHPAPDRANLVEEAQALTAHAEFDDETPLNGTNRDGGGTNR